MSARFEDLREILLRGGIAPRHIRRYLRELEEHYADLYAAQREAGFEPDDAGIRARARLGGDAELARAMIEQRDFRAFSARFPWLVFTVMPPVTMLLVVVVPLLLVALLGFIGGKLLGMEGVEPRWFQLLVNGMFATVNFLTIPLSALLFTIIAWRQRLSAWWVLLAIAVMAPLIWCAGMDFPTAAEAAKHKPASLYVGFGLITNGNGDPGPATHIAGRAAHYILSLMPLAWLVLARRGILAKVPFLS
jgi:hypothetical protein